MGEPSSSWQNFNFRDDEGSAQGMQALRLLLAKLQEAQANPRLKPSVNNLLMIEDLMLTSTQRLPSSVAPMHLEGGKGVPVMHGPMQANVVPHPLQGPLQTDGAKKKQYHGQERHVGKIREEGDFHDDDDEPPSRSRHKKRTNERRTKRSRRNSSGALLHPLKVVVVLMDGLFLNTLVALQECPLRCLLHCLLVGAWLVGGAVSELKRVPCVALVSNPSSTQATIWQGYCFMLFCECFSSGASTQMGGRAGLSVVELLLLLSILICSCEVLVR
ncbi:hypothetical protein L7F22_040687 [Adiantum nelumboides]|nr:hypothetical protein [Adiantum nelumboides]